MWDFHTRFLPWALKHFSATPRLRVVAWVEDDCTLQPGLTADDVLEAFRACNAPVAWSGYKLRHGRPFWGSHMVAMTRKGATELKRAMDKEAAAWKGTRTPAAYCQGLDTWLRQAHNRGGHLVACPAAPVCYQRGHALQGRR